MDWRYVEASDIAQLVTWNRNLQEDEGSEPMSVDLLRPRMHRFLAGNYEAVIFSETATPVGYALFRPTDVDLEGPDGIFVQQFFITREHRRNRMGATAFALIANEIRPGHKIILEALTTNARGQAFWRSMGFEPYSTVYHLTPASDD